MSKYTIDILTRYCIENNVILLKDYSKEKMGCEVIIECKCYKDGCQSKIQKSFGYLLKMEAYCRSCNKNRKQNTFQTFMDCVKNDRVKQGTWYNKENHKLYAEWLGQTLGYRTMEDWYKVTFNIINENYGSGLIKYYQGSSVLFLKSVFPQENWLEWKFVQTSQGFWNEKIHHQLYAIWLGEILGYRTMEDWYNLTVDIITKNYGAGLLTRHYKGSPFLFIKDNIPNNEWLGWKFKVAPYHFWNLESRKTIRNMARRKTEL